jgi:hypothetical protein
MELAFQVALEQDVEANDAMQCSRTFRIGFAKCQEILKTSLGKTAFLKILH